MKRKKRLIDGPHIDYLDGVATHYLGADGSALHFPGGDVSIPKPTTEELLKSARDWLVTAGHCLEALGELTANGDDPGSVQALRALRSAFNAAYADAAEARLVSK
jgi:hypothetical protein